VEDGGIKFDYKFNIGKSYFANAIKILELNNYPKEIIEEAHSNFRNS
jgi:DNA mismatch repair ATPase MutS